MQAHITLPFTPFITKRGYFLWKLSPADVRSVIENGSLEHSVRDSAMRHGDFGGYHSTARARANQPASPIRDALPLLPEFSKRGRVLYHGVGRDAAGAIALERGGRHKVITYDPFHPDKAVRSFPRGKFREVWSIYTLCALSAPECMTVMREINTLLDDISSTKSGTAFAMIAVRRGSR